MIPRGAVTGVTDSRQPCRLQRTISDDDAATASLHILAALVTAVLADWKLGIIKDKSKKEL